MGIELPRHAGFTNADLSTNANFMTPTLLHSVLRVDLPESPLPADVGFGTLAPTAALKLAPLIERQRVERGLPGGCLWYWRKFRDELAVGFEWTQLAGVMRDQ